MSHRVVRPGGGRPHGSSLAPPFVFGGVLPQVQAGLSGLFIQILIGDTFEITPFGFGGDVVQNRIEVG